MTPFELSSEGEAPGSNEELWRLFDLADSYQARVDLAKRRLLTIRLMAALVGLGSVIAAILALVFWSGGRRIDAGFATGIAAYLIVSTAVVQTMFANRQRHEGERDVRALREVVDLLREVTDPSPTRAQSSALERAELRIRLARFDQ